jgi:hypothetical protein
MPTVYTEVEINLSDIDDDELAEELESRGWTVFAKGDKPDDIDETVQEMIWRYKNGYIEDAMFLLERRFPEMHGISKRIK